MALAGDGAGAPLNTFGAVLRYAIEMEERASQLLSDAAGKAVDARVSGLLRDQASARSKRAREVTRIRRENVAEMILEPIADMDGASYLHNASVSDVATDADLMRLASALEADSQRFYLDAGRRLSIVEVSRALARLARECAQSQSRTDSLLASLDA
jgi:rubrerythrin